MYITYIYTSSHSLQSVNICNGWGGSQVHKKIVPVELLTKAFPVFWMNKF